MGVALHRQAGEADDACAGFQLARQGFEQRAECGDGKALGAQGGGGGGGAGQGFVECCDFEAEEFAGPEAAIFEFAAAPGGGATDGGEHVVHGWGCSARAGLGSSLRVDEPAYMPRARL